MIKMTALARASRYAVVMALALAAGLASQAARAVPTTYSATIDTTAIAGQSGAIAFDLFDGIGLPPARVGIASFASDGVAGNSRSAGRASGDLLTDDGVVLTTGGFFASTVQELVFGQALAFRFTLDGFAGTAAAVPHRFGIAVLDAATRPYATTDPLGTDALISATSGLKRTAQAYTGQAVSAAIQIANDGGVAVPEPPALALMVLGVALLGLGRAPRSTSCAAAVIVALGAVAAVPQTASAEVLYKRAQAEGAQARGDAGPRAAPFRLQAASSACAQDPGTIVDSLSVPKGQQTRLSFLLTRPAPKGGVTITTTVDDPNIAPAGNASFGLAPIVFIPEGQTKSPPITINGARVGSTRLRHSVLPPINYFLPTPVSVWDVGLGEDERSLDMNPRSEALSCLAGSRVSDDPAVLAQCGAEVDGIVADGTSRLLLRLRAGLPGTGCYELATPDGSPTGEMAEAASATTPQAGSNYVFGAYRPPDTWGSSHADARPVNATVSYKNDPRYGRTNVTTINTQITLHPVPELLVHGLWSSGDAWGDMFRDPEDGALREPRVVDYGDSSGGAFDENVSAVKGGLVKVINKLIGGDSHIAASQADVIAHSMGGSLARVYAADSDAYLRPENYGEGDIRRLVTLSTPHWGSSLANLLVHLAYDDQSTTQRTVSKLLHRDAPLDQGAVCDLAENSLALQALASGTQPKSHAITASGGPAGTVDEPAEYWGGALGGLVSSFEAALTAKECVPDGARACRTREYVFPQNVVDVYRFREANDVIVSRTSQQGGLPNDNFANLIHFAGAPFQTGIAESAPVAGHARELLDGGPEAFAEPPPVPSDGSGEPREPLGNLQSKLAYSAMCGEAGALRPAAQRFSAQATTGEPQGDPRLRVTSPNESEAFAPGSTITVRVERSNQLETRDVSLAVLGPGLSGIVDADGPFTRDGPGPVYTYQFTLSEEFVGEITLSPGAREIGEGLVQGERTRIFVRPTQPPESIELNEELMILEKSDRFPHPTNDIRVYGQYSDGVERNITNPAFGTTFTSSDPSVAVVEAGENGEPDLVPGGRTGTAIITARNGDAEALIRVWSYDRRVLGTPQEVTGRLAIERSGFGLDRETGYFVQRVTFRNTGDLPLMGSLYVLFEGLPESVRLVNQYTETSRIMPKGVPFKELELSDGHGDGAALLPGDTSTLRLEFFNRKRKPIDYDISVLQMRYHP